MTKTVCKWMGLALAVPCAILAQSLPVAQDAYVVPGSATNFGTGVNLTVGSSASQGLVQFDLSALPAGLTTAQVQKAALILYVNHVNTGGTINIYAANGPWGELTVNGTNGPAPGAVVASVVPVSSSGQYITVDATAAVQGWVTAPTTNNGFLISGNGSTSVQFDSKEATNTSHAAVLAITLANAGSQGAAGATGAIGATGPQGPAGASGAAGANGAMGATGAQGPAGVPGATGATGASGTNGTNGNTVLTGTAAPVAGTGNNGDFYLLTTTSCLYGPKAAGAWPGTCTNLVGPAGATGSTGAAGSQGPQGATGSQGSAGAAGATGAAGAPGTNGANGNTVLNGTAAPVAGTGNNGDFYLLTTTHCFYGPKASGAWPGTCTTLVGPAGATGSTGSAGSQGSVGATGAQGPAGAAGATGANGTNGNTVLSGTTAPVAGTGNNGDFYLLTTTHCFYGPKASGAWPGTCTTLVGPAGATGSTGSAGSQGPAGATGAAGAQGPTGPAGPQGPQGPQGPAGSGGSSGSPDIMLASRSAADPCPNSVGRPCTNPYSLFIDSVDKAASGTCVSFDLTNQLIQLNCPGQLYIITLDVTAVVPTGRVLGYSMYLNSTPGSTGIEAADSTFRGRIDGTTPGNNRTAQAVFTPSAATTVSIGWEYPISGGYLSSTSTRVTVLTFN